jgi:twinkle protein
VEEIKYEVGVGYPCELCNSEDNVRYFENGSLHCFSPGCTFHSFVGDKEVSTNPELVFGDFTPLANRRISQRTCEVFNYQTGMFNNQPCHIANIVGEKGKIVAQQLRLPDKDFCFRGNSKDLGLVYKHLWGNRGKSVVITEGYIDALSIAECQDCKWPVVTVPNGAQSAVKAIKKDLAWLLNFESIVLCFDNDEAGQQAVEDCVCLFPPGRVKIAQLSEKDANDVLVKGKGRELTNIVFTASDYRPDNVVSGSDINIETLFEPEPRGLDIPFPILNEMIRGLKKHRIYTVYAGTGAGKTSIMKEIVYNIRKTRPEITVANVYLEESFKYTIKSYIALDNDLPTFRIEENPDLLSLEAKIKSYKGIIYNEDEGDRMLFYKHFGSLDSKRLFNMLEYFVIGKGAEIVVLDHLSILISGLDSAPEGERVVIDNVMTKLRSFTERTGCVVLLATQLRRTEGSYNTGAAINESSARGSGSVEHLSDVIFSLNRNVESENPNDARLRVIKNRVSGIIGEADLIVYNSNTGRYLPKPTMIQQIKQATEMAEELGLLNEDSML